MQEPATNVPEYSVSEISGAVKRTLEGAFGRVRVRGEITELKRYPSGHIYFSLKDESTKIAGIIWKGSVSRLGLVPENGIEVIATGKVTAYGERSNYQIIVERMEFAGAGALLARIELLRQKLLAEGLFSADRKRQLPLLPQLIGVITSPQGAVIQDIRTTIARRFPRDILLWPVPVQGEGAAAKIAAAIRGFNALPLDIPRPDVLIVARGGGSLEDLMAFNDEDVVRAAAASRIPLISAVGHETDTTLIDFASDQRAPTPTAAAELAVPARSELVANLAQKSARLAGALSNLAQSRKLRLSQAAGRLPDPASLLAQARIRLDDRGQRLELALPNFIAARHAGLDRTTARLPDPRTLLAQARLRLDERTQRLGLALPNLLAGRRAGFDRIAAGLLPALRHTVARRHTNAAALLSRLSPVPLQALLRERRARLEGAGRQLESVSPLAVLSRGYALVTNEAGVPVTAAVQISSGNALSLRFQDGSRKVIAK